MMSPSIQNNNNNYLIKSNSKPEESFSDNSSFFSHGFIISDKRSTTKKKEKLSNTNSVYNLNAQNNNNKDTNMSSNSVCVIQTDESDFYTKKIITESDILLNKKLLISELEGNQLCKGNLIINCGGMLNGKRNKRDGIAIFGINSAEGNLVSSNEDDFVFNLKISATNNVINNSNHHLFFIYYSMEKRKYYIRLFNNNTDNIVNYTPYISSFFLVKINGTFPIKESEFLMIGDLMFSLKADYTKLTICKQKSKNSPEEVQKEFIYEDDSSFFTIGRSSKCDLSFQYDKSFSKVHCTIMFNKKDMLWYIYDGNLGKKSTNGIWLIPRKSFEIYDGMNFKILGCSKCEINIKE